MELHMPTEQWYYSRGGERLGPVGDDALRSMAAAGTLTPHDFVWRDGMPDWAPAGTVPGLFALPPQYAAAPQQAAQQYQNAYPPAQAQYPGQAYPPPGYPATPPGYAPMNYYTPPQNYPSYGGFWLRFVAYIIDVIVMWIPNAILTYGAELALDGTIQPPQINPANIQSPDQIIELYKKLFFTPGKLTGIALTLIATWIYYALMESSSKQATLGKMALGLKVTDLNGARISFAKASGRYFGKILSSFLCLIGYIMAGFTERKQALHDMMAGSLVMKKP
jgi:uncharacterized RDD family membrane protein YckC